jgi:hypothetical protein
MSVFGITLTAASGFTESVDVEKKAEVKQLLTSEGHHGDAVAYDHVYTFSARGKGDNPYTAGAGNAGISAVEGAAFITSCKTTTKNDDWQGWEISGTSYVHAS